MYKHVPVLIKEVISSLDDIDEDKIYIDCTFGLGGYSKNLLQTKCKVIGIDRDPDVEIFANELKKDFPNNFQFFLSKFSDINKLSIEKVNSSIFDFGVSSFQLDNADRGFSFQKEGPLDMRMSKNGITAEHVINNMDESDLADILYFYGEELKSRKIAKIIVQNRPFKTTIELASIIEKNIKKTLKIHPATLTFQAIRVFVNDELNEINLGLKNVLDITTEKILCVTFQGLENRVVKDFARENKLKLLKSYSPTKKELIHNPRSRSAKLRVYGL